MKKLFRKLAALNLALTLVICGAGLGIANPEQVSATTSSDVEWAGMANNLYNNNVTDVQLPKTAKEAELRWKKQIGHDSGGSYYAGNSVVVGNYVYVTGQGKLWKIDKTTGEAQSKEGIGSASGNRPDYSCTDGQNIYVASETAVEAVSLDTMESVWKKEGTYGPYHPVQLLTVNKKDYLWCNGYVYEASTGEAVAVYEDEKKTAELDKSSFSWSSGALVDGIFYVTGYNKVYAVDLAQGKVLSSVEYSEAKDNASGQTVYDEGSGRLFWGSKAENKLFSIKADEELDSTSLKSTNTLITTVNSPVVYKDAVYLTGQSNGKSEPIAQIFSVGSDGNMTLKYSIGKTASAEGGSVQLIMTQSNPIVSEGQDGLVYMYFQDYYGDIYAAKEAADRNSAELVQLIDTPNPSNVAYPYAYEQFAIDRDGSIYCYNESGYIFGYGKKEKTLEMTVSISDRGELVKAKDDSVMARKNITVKDADKDGKFTVNDALIAAHDSYYNGGAAEGYRSAPSPYGTAIEKLWGDESGAFSYWLNDKSCWSLDDEVKDGDYVVAFIYKDQTYWGDSYSKFDSDIYSCMTGQKVKVNVSESYYDDNYEIKFKPSSQAKVSVIGGTAEPVVTNADGQAELIFTEPGTYQIQAWKDNGLLVPCVATVNVKAKIEDVTTTVSLNKGATRGIKVTVTVPEAQKADKTGMIIYRSKSKDSGYVKYKSVAVSGSSYSITNTKDAKGNYLTEGTRYYYKAKAYAVINGNTYYGPMSDVKSLTPKITDVKATVSLSTKNISRGIKVTVKVPETQKAEKKGFIIYRSTKKASGYVMYKKVAVKGSTYSITNTKDAKGNRLVKGKTYYYKVKTYKVVNGKTYYGTMSAVKYMRAK